MKHLIIIQLLVLFTFISHAQHTISHQNTLGGSDYEQGGYVAINKNNIYVLIGSSSPISGNKTSPHYGMMDYWLLCLDSNLSIQWQKSYGGDGNDIPSDLLIINDRLYLIGTSGSQSSGTKTMDLFSSTGYDIWLVCTDLSGNELWQNQYGGNGNDQSGKLYNYGNQLLFTSKSNSDSSGTKTQDTIGAYDFWIVSIDTLGATIWDKTIGGTLNEEIPALFVDGLNRLIISGSSTSNASGHKSENRFGANPLYPDVWVVYYYPDLDSIFWDKTIGGEGNDFVSDVMIFDSIIYVLSYSDSDVSGTKTSVNYSSYDDIWINKLSSNGSILWDKVYGGIESDYPEQIVINGTDQLIVFGSSASSASGSLNSSGNGYSDNLILFLDTAGNQLSDKLLGGSLTDAINDIVYLGNDRYLLAGVSSSPVSGDKIQNSLLLDIWTYELNLSMGLSSIDTKSEIKIFPNPLSEIFNISMDKKSKNPQRLSIYNALGQLVLQQHLPAFINEHRINIQDLPSGVYLVKVVSDNHVVYSGMVVKE